MKIKVNGRFEELEKPVSVVQLLEKKGIKPGQAVVQYNGDIVGKDTWGQIILRENDELEILRFVGGG